MKYITQRPEPSIPYNEGMTHSEVRQISFVNDLGIPNKKVCFFCHRELSRDDLRPWVGTAGFEVDSGVTCYIQFFHCRDCHPNKIENALPGKAFSQEPSPEWQEKE